MNATLRQLGPSILMAWAVAFVLRLPIAAIPLERDEGEYAYIAQRWWAGEVPYRDSFDQKPPGTFVAYAVILRLFGESPELIHWGAQLYTFGTLAFIALVGRRLLGPAVGGTAAVLAAFMTGDVAVLGNAANTETFMILPLTAGLWATLLAVERGSAGWAFAAGGCGSLAMLCKQVAAPNVLLYAGIMVALGRPRVKLLAAMVAGGVVASVPVVGYFASVGAWRDFYDCVLGHNFAYAQRMPLAAYPVTLWSTFGPLALKWAPIPILAVVGWCGPDDGPHPRIAKLWLLASLAGVAAGGYFRQHYYIQMIPPLAVLAGRGLAVIGRRSPSLMIAGALAAVAYGVALSPDYYLTGTPAEKCRAIYGSNPFPESPVAADWIDLNTRSDDPVFVFGSEPQILFYAGRPSASRYIFAYPLMTPFADAADRQDDVIRELQRRPPRVVIKVASPYSFLRANGAPTQLEEWLDTMLRVEYRLAAAIDPDDLSIDAASRLTAEQLAGASLLIWVRRGPR